MYLRSITHLIGILLLLHKIGASYFFSAITDMEPLVNTESKLIDQLKQFLRKEEKSLEKLRKYVPIYKTLSIKSGLSKNIV